MKIQTERNLMQQFPKAYDEIFSFKSKVIAEQWLKLHASTFL